MHRKHWFEVKGLLRQEHLYNPNLALACPTLLADRAVFRQHPIRQTQQNLIVLCDPTVSILESCLLRLRFRTSLTKANTKSQAKETTQASSELILRLAGAGRTAFCSPMCRQRIARILRPAALTVVAVSKG